MNKTMSGNWLLLRGLARESGHWCDFPLQLQQAFPDAKVFGLDLPGTGSQRQWVSPCRLDKITDHVRAQALNSGLLEQPVMLLAVSLGAMVVWDWLRRYPDDCIGAVLINTSFAGVSPFYQRLRWQNYARFLSLITQKTLFDREKIIVGMVSNNSEHYAEVAKTWAEIQANRPIKFKVCMNQLLAAARFEPGDAPMTKPVLLLSGGCDRLVSPACSIAISQKWSLPLAVHAWGGHDLTLDDGVWVIEQIKFWLPDGLTQT